MYVYIMCLHYPVKKNVKLRIYVIYQYVQNMNITHGILYLSLGISDFVSAGVSASCDCVFQ